VVRLHHRPLVLKESQELIAASVVDWGQSPREGAGFLRFIIHHKKQSTMKWNYDPKEGSAEETTKENAGQSEPDTNVEEEQGASQEEE
jgi:hypothetical protein